MGCFECFQMFVYLLCSNCKRVYSLLEYALIAPLFIYLFICFTGWEGEGCQCGAVAEVSLKITLASKGRELPRKHKVPDEWHYDRFFPFV